MSDFQQRADEWKAANPIIAGDASAAEVATQHKLLDQLCQLVAAEPGAIEIGFGSYDGGGDSGSVELVDGISDDVEDYLYPYLDSAYEFWGFNGGLYTSGALQFDPAEFCVTAYETYTNFEESDGECIANITVDVPEAVKDAIDEIEHATFMPLNELDDEYTAAEGDGDFFADFCRVRLKDGKVPDGYADFVKQLRSTVNAAIRGISNMDCDEDSDSVTLSIDHIDVPGAVTVVSEHNFPLVGEETRRLYLTDIFEDFPLPELEATDGESV